MSAPESEPDGAPRIRAADLEREAEGGGEPAPRTDAAGNAAGNAPTSSPDGAAPADTTSTRTNPATDPATDPERAPGERPPPPSTPRGPHSGPRSGVEARAARAEAAREEDAEARPRRRGGPFAVLALLAVLLGAGAGLWTRVQLAPPAAAGEARPFEVESGWGAARVAAELEAAGLIRDARVFGLWLRLQGRDRALGEGLYDLSPAMSSFEVADALAEGGRPRTERVVIPEGFRLGDVVDRLAASGLGAEAELLALAREPGELAPAWLPADAGLEGYLFPASYDVPVEAPPERALAGMVARFEDEITDEVRSALDAAGLSVHDWVTLASMVQAEAADHEEMPIIAGVFRNRLDRGMLLQSDPTVAYGLGKDLPELNVFAGDFETDHPWNTYTRPGLPVGPIGNPGSDALRAVLEPERLTDAGEPWLFFLHGVDRGEIVFRPNTTLADHNRDVQEYLR